MSDGKPDGMSERAIGWAIILALIGVCAYILYRNYTPEVLGTIRWLRFAEMWLFSLLTPDSYMVTLDSGDRVNLQEWVDGVGKIPAEKIDTDLLGAITAIALTPYKWFVVVMIGVIGIWAYKFGPGTQYTEVFNLDGLIRFQSKNFPVISPIVNFNPNKQPPRAPGSPVPAELPLFAEALGPEEWLAYNQIPVPDGTVDEAAAFKAFSRQLGKRWRGAKHLAPYQQILLAACCLKASRKRDDSDKIMGRLALCWTHDKGLQLSKDKSLVRHARKILANKDISYHTLKLCNQHAWETTALLRGLATAREEGGVLAPAQFIWLRGHNRELWYPMNNLGRKSHHIEAIGAMAHFYTERRAQRPIPKPKVEEAVQSIVTYMNSMDARPIPALDYSQSSNKRGIKKPKTKTA